GWVDWNIGERGEALIAFVKKLTELRHRYPMLRRGRFLTGDFDEQLGIRDITWLNPAGTEMTEEGWKDGNARCFGVLLDGRARPSGIRKRGEDATLLIVFNAWHDGVEFTLPEIPDGGDWELLIDTNNG